MWVKGRIFIPQLIRNFYIVLSVFLTMLDIRLLYLLGDIFRLNFFFIMLLLRMYPYPMVMNFSATALSICVFYSSDILQSSKGFLLLDVYSFSLCFKVVLLLPLAS